MGIPDRFEKMMTSAARRADVPDSSPAPDAATDDVQRSLNRLARQMGQLRGLVYQQADMLTEALQRAGWQSADETTKQRSLQRTLRAIESDDDIIVGPWTGEVGFELLYWIPFVSWLMEQRRGGRRVTVISRGGAAPWYRHLASRYVDLLDLMTPDQFRQWTGGPKKQVDTSSGFDDEIVETVRRQLGLEKAGLVHPSAMFRLFAPFWRRRAGVDLVESFTSYRPLSLPDVPVAVDAIDLPPQYVICKFYFSKAFPDTAANRAFAADLIRTISRDVPVVLLSTGMRLDEHSDFQTAGGSGVYVVDAHAAPQRNLEVQTRLIAAARGFVGTYGGFSYLAPFYGVRSVSFFSRRAGFENHHLQLADRVFDELLPGGFVALDRRAHALVQPAIARWLTAANETVYA